MNNSIKIQIVKSNDVTSLSYLVFQLGYSGDDTKTSNRLSKILKQNDHCVYTAEVNEQIVGWIHAFITYRVESDAFVEIGGLVVDDKHRKQGIGKALVDAVIDWAKEKNMPKVRVRCNIIRDDAHAFYEQIGFEKKKEQNIFDKIIQI